MNSRMKNIASILLTLLTLLTLPTTTPALAEGRESGFPTLKGPYLGQQPPGLKAEPFAPAVLSIPGKNHHTLSFSTNGQELYFSRYPERVTLMMRQVDGIWQPPVSSPVPGWEAIFTPDGQSLIFGDGDLWIMRRTASGWNHPEKLPGAVNTTNHEYYATASNDGTLYFSRIVNERAMILRARPAGGRYDSVEELETAVNGIEAYHPFVAPDGSYLLFNSRHRPGGYGGADLYVSFRQPGGSFGAPVNLGPEVNSADFDLAPVVSPDGKYLFFTRLGRDSDGSMTGTPYWVSSKVIEAARTSIFAGRQSPRPDASDRSRTPAIGFGPTSPPARTTDHP